MTEAIEKKWFDAHLSTYKKNAYISDMEQYEQMYRRSLDEPDGFWGEMALEYLTWKKPWDFVFKYDREECIIQWFGGGVLNASYNCLDRHIEEIGDKIAYFWEGDDPKETSSVTYKELYRRVNKVASYLKSRNINKGDKVIIYLPMVVELPVAMLACARIGAVHSVVFGGFSAEALASRIKDCDAKMVITADAGYRSGKIIPLMNTVREALKSCKEVETVLIYKRSNIDISLNPNLEFWWDEALSDTSISDEVEPEPMDAEDPLFILYTSGSTGRPKGVLHTHGGYLLYCAMTTKIVFDLKLDEVFWCTADIGWVTGHSYGVYGPLINGITSVIFEGIPTYPAFDRYWDIISKYKVAKFYTSPTAMRSLAKEGDEWVKKHDISSLKILGSVGEPLNPEAWKWFFHNVGRDICPIMDTWWQTETGGHMLTPLPAITPIKPGSVAIPFFGIDPVILDDTGKETIYPNQEGALCIRRPWPGIARTLYNAHDFYKDIYFSRVPGMYFTGDGAKCDEDGYYWILGRIDDVINVSGHRLGTAEVESALMLHQQVAEAAVVGYPHSTKGQGIYAFITLNTGVEPTDELRKELITLVRTEIGPIATIDVMQWADVLPKTRSGKILRRVLQKIAAGHDSGFGDLSTSADPSIVKRLIKERKQINGN